MRTTTIVQFVFAFVLLILPAVAIAQPFEKPFHVGVDFTTAHHTGNQTAFLYDENYNQFPNSSLNVKSSQIIVDQWLGRSGSQVAWFLGVVEIQVILRNDATEEEEDVTDTPAFTEMNHHFVTEYWQGENPNTTRQATDPCGLIRPIGAGSELTPAVFPTGYAFNVYDKGFLGGWKWHWANPAEVEIGENESVYLRFTLRFHKTESSSSYVNTNVTWLHANDGSACDPHLCVATGTSTETSPEYTAAGAGRIVLAMPHVHDHGTEVRLMRTGDPPTTLRTFTVSEDFNYPAEHHCDMDSWHVHTTAVTAHLPVGGLEAWAPGGGGPTFSSGDKFYCEADFNNPHDAIDNMAIVVIFTAAN